MKILKKFLLSTFLLMGTFSFAMNSVGAISNQLNCQNTLSYSDRGSEVKILQTELNDIMKCNLEIDGIFGTKTKQCVRIFQQKYSLAVDAIVGPDTCKQLNISYQKESNKSYVVVTVKQLNVRAQANTNSSIYKKVSMGTVLRIYGSKKVNDITWYKILVNQNNGVKKYGYISEKYARKTAILLNISKQTLSFYQDGKILMDVPVVTGMKNVHDTPVGHYIVHSSNKVLGKTLRGKNDNGTTYAAYVQYWMPFITERGIGFHDASWRNDNEFIKDTYQNNGSHGCVNMRTNDAKMLYDNIIGDVDVIVI